MLWCCGGPNAKFPNDSVESVLEVKKKNGLWCVCCFANVLVCSDGKCEEVCGFVWEAAEGVVLECVLCVAYELLSEKGVDSFC